MRVGVVVGLAVASVVGIGTVAGAAPAWRVVPTAAGMAYGNVSSVRCPSATVCFAVGNRDNPHSQSTMAQRWNGTKWVALNTPLPAGAVSSQLTIRDNFLDQLKNVLREGADKLTVADQNEEGANLLSLQTRQQLGVISLSLANQSQQAILRLF